MRRSVAQALLPVQVVQRHSLSRSLSGLCPGLLVLCSIAAFAPIACGEYIVLRSGQRLVVTGYQLIGDKYRLQIVGGTVEVPATEVMAIEPEEVFTPEPKPAPSAAAPKAPFRELVDAAAARYSVDANLVYSVIAAESNFDPKAISHRNARGLMQLMPETASRLGVKNIFDPKENIDAGTRYLSELLLRYNNDLVLTLAAYNAGPERVAQYGSRVPPYRETQSYVLRVKRKYAEAQSSAASAKKDPAAKSASKEAARSPVESTDSRPRAVSKPATTTPANSATEKPQSPGAT
jgi:Transglycosylase SLT domain